MDFGEILYIIIGIAWVLYSFRRKKKTKNPQDHLFGQKAGPEVPQHEESKILLGNPAI